MVWDHCQCPSSSEVLGVGDSIVRSHSKVWSKYGNNAYCGCRGERRSVAGMTFDERMLWYAFKTPGIHAFWDLNSAGDGLYEYPRTKKNPSGGKNV